MITDIDSICLRPQALIGGKGILPVGLPPTVLVTEEQGEGGKAPETSDWQNAAAKVRLDFAESVKR